MVRSLWFHRKSHRVVLKIAVLSFNRINWISIISLDNLWNHYPLIPESSFTLRLKRISGALSRFMCIHGSWRVRSCVSLRATTLPNTLFASRPPCNSSNRRVIKRNDSEKLRSFGVACMHSTRVEEAGQLKRIRPITLKLLNPMVIWRITPRNNVPPKALMWVCLCMCVYVCLTVPELPGLRRTKTMPYTHAMAHVNILLRRATHPRGIRA